MVKRLITDLNTIINVVLVRPEIPQNTGNIIRLCANVGATLHLVKPLGFNLSDRKLVRAGLDYIDTVNIISHDSLEELFGSLEVSRCFGALVNGPTLYTSPQYRTGDTIIFGQESIGLDKSTISLIPAGNLLRIPMAPSNRSLNLANAVSIIVYEMWRQIDFKGSDISQVKNRYYH